MKTANLSVKARQQILAAAIGTAGVCAIGGLVYCLFDEGKLPKADADKQFSKETNIASVSKQVDPQEIWVERMESHTKLMNEKVSAIEKLLMENIKSNGQQTDEINTLKEEITLLQNRVPAASNSITPDGYPVAPSQSFDGSQPLTDGALNFDQAPVTGGNHPASNHKITIALKTGAGFKKGKHKTVENTIPATAFVKAILLSGVDAGTGVDAETNPSPVTLRIIDHGNLPRGFKSDLKGCRVSAAASGVLASERVKMRIEKLTCTEPLTGEIIETQVAGYIAGEDGREGLRGIVVDRAGEAMRNLFLAGFVGGLSNFVGAQQQRSVYPISPFGQSNALTADKMLGAGAAQGANNAMEKFADFYIKRAEQLQPVVQIAAGREVDIIFTEGTDIGGSSVKQAIKKVRDQSRQETISKLESQPDHANWLPNGEQHD